MALVVQQPSPPEFSIRHTLAETQTINEVNQPAETCMGEALGWITFWHQASDGARYPCGLRFE